MGSRRRCPPQAATLFATKWAVCLGLEIRQVATTVRNLKDPLWLLI